MESTDEAGTSTDAEEQLLDTDDIFHLLQNQRRRRVLKYLRENDEGDGVDMREVVEWIAAKEHDTTIQALRSEERQRVYIALYQSHLPKLDDAGVIEYDQRKGWVTRTESTETVEQYVVPNAATSEEDESEHRSHVRIDSAATGFGAVLLLAGYSGFVPLVSDFVVSIGLFALMAIMAFAHLRRRAPAST